MLSIHGSNVLTVTNNIGNVIPRLTDVSSADKRPVHTEMLVFSSQ